MTLLAVISPLFTAPSFRVFCGLACGFLAQPGKRTVCGMLAGAGLSRLWPHDRAHLFFSRSRWSADDLGPTAALHALPPARTGRPSRPRVKGDRLPSLAKLAATTAFSQVTVNTPSAFRSVPDAQGHAGLSVLPACVPMRPAAFLSVVRRALAVVPQGSPCSAVVPAGLPADYEAVVLR
jgi:hypothetical protein